MANSEHLTILKQGIPVWNEWRRNNKYIRPDLSDTDLNNTDLSSIDFTDANLGNTNFVEANLSNAIFRDAIIGQTNFERANLQSANLAWADLMDHVYLWDADLTGASLCGANLDWTMLSGAKLIGANLQDANCRNTSLDEVDFSQAILDGTLFESTSFGNANFHQAVIGNTIFADVDLSTARGLDRTIHKSPSTIGIDTIFRSKGNIPDVFLRGCGVPDIFIEYSKSLSLKPIEFYSCFISHSSKDRKFCDRLHADLQANGVRVWYFYEDAKWGEEVWGEIDRSIKIYDKLIVVCSKNSLSSGPVLREIERALNRVDREAKNVLFPIRLDDYILNDWENPRKADVLSKVVGDFRGWNRSVDNYRVAFQKLLKTLKAEDR